MNRIFRLLVVILLVWISGCSRRNAIEKESSPGESASIQSILESKRPPQYVSGDDDGIHLWKMAHRFYNLRNNQTAWISGTHPRRQMDALIQALEQSNREGLNPADYDLDTLRTKRAEAANSGVLRRESFAPSAVADFDVHLTYVFFKYANHLLAGRIDPEDVDPHWFASPRKVDLANLLEKGLDEDQIESALRQLAPPHPEYAALRDALARYREIAAKGGWPKLPENMAIKKEANSQYVSMLHQRLAITGDLKGAPGEGRAAQAGGNAQYDRSLQDSIRTFEKRHGLKVDGLADRELVAELNVSVEQRIRQMELNMERWRWLPDNLGQRHILVNIPDYQLYVIENDLPVLTMRVVVGKKDNPTPIFSDQMTHIIFSPYWNIPESIAKKETIPHILKDPDYLAKNHIDIVTRSGQVIDPANIDWSQTDNLNYRFRQRPGKGNSMGGVKFMFPNQFNVYLHDTPAEKLFGRVERDFSHGCVRVEEPVDLARYVLRDQPMWTEETIKAAMNSGQERTVQLKNPISVHLLYWTAWVDKDGTVEFRDDIYGYGAAQERMLRQRENRDYLRSRKP